MILKDIILCLAFSITMPVGQLLFKWAANNYNLVEGPPFPRILYNYALWGAFGWYAITALLWFYILTKVPLTLAYPASLLGAGIVPLLAWAVFGEPLSWRLLAGYVLLLAGVYLTTTSTR